MAILLAPAVKVDGDLLRDSWLEALTEVRVERGFQVPARATLRFDDSGYRLLSTNHMKLGTNVTITAPDGGDLLEAEVTGISAEQPEGEQPELIVFAHDRGHRLGRSTKVTTYLQMQYSDVVAKIAQNADLRSAVDSTDVVVDYLLQVDTDLGLITELARRVGFDWWVDGKTLHFKRPAAAPPSVTLTLHRGLRSFSVRATGQYADSVSVAGWDRQRQEQVSAVAATPSSGVTSDSELADLVASPGTAFGQATLATAGLAALSQDEAKQLSQALRDRAAASSVTARGVVDGNSQILPGVRVQVSGAGPLNGSYPVTQVEHIFQPISGFQTRFVTGDRSPASLADIFSGGAGSAPATQHPGLVVGQVTNINDPDKVGRVKVRYPGLSPTDESAWARLASIGGGKSRGSVFIPEVGDEVLVGFEAGDPRQPVVLGGLFGDKSSIPNWSVEGGKVGSRGLTSRLGHVVQLADGDDPATQFVLVQLAGQKHTLRLGKDKVDLEVPGGTPLSIKSGNTSMIFAGDGSISIQGTNVTIKAQQNLSLEGLQGSLKANGQLSVEASGQASFKGAVVQVEGSGVVGVKGGIVQIN
jgi:phage protein D/phage baseplate assembly protein gpV